MLVDSFDFAEKVQIIFSNVSGLYVKLRQPAVDYSLFRHGIDPLIKGSKKHVHCLNCRSFFAVKVEPQSQISYCRPIFYSSQMLYSQI